uniref:RING-type E3 ubiquitin transferase n=1 Tax=Zooxanthella nutricula TaxID=1333877 RepID=A0A7S2M237_9DINO
MSMTIDTPRRSSSSLSVMSMDSLGSMQAPTKFEGMVRKQSHGAWVHWSKRKFILQDGMLFWSKNSFSGETVELLQHPKIRYIDLARTSIEARELSAAGIISLKPTSGNVWFAGDRHSSVGTTRSILFDAGEEHEKLMQSVMGHIDFAESSVLVRVASGSSWQSEGLNLQTTPIDELPEGCELECSVCCQELCDCGDDLCGVVRTGCGHHFHAACLHRWTVKSKTCPLCRSSLQA